jgi:Galactose oxidase, central domain
MTVMSSSTIYKRCENQGWRKVRPLRVLIAVAALVALCGSPALAATARWRIKPKPLGFGHVKTGTALQKSFQIKSTGKATLTGVVGNTFEGAGAAYFKVVSGAGSFSLAPGQVLLVTVQFQPIKQGPSGGAKIVITSNAGRSSNATVKESFSGAGQGPAAAATATATATPSATPTGPTPTATSTPIVPVTGLSGQILVAGGMSGSNQALNTADLYNVIAGAFDCSGLGGVNTATGACNVVMDTARYDPSVVALQNGEILVAGGNGPGVVCYNTAELYNPATNIFTSTGSMFDAHCYGAPATLLQNGQVLITGGNDATGGPNNNADLYDPTAGTFGCGNLGGTNTTSGYCNNTMTDKRYLHTATLLPSGKVLIAGGNDSHGAAMVATAEIFDPTTGTFGCGDLGGADSKGHCLNTMSDSREFHTATLLTTGPNAGDVLIAGGIDLAGKVLQTAELYDQSAGAFSCVGSVSANPPLCNNSMTQVRYLHTATLLDPAYVSGPNAGSVLIAGGEGQSGKVLNTAELYNPAAGTFTATGNMTTGRAMQFAQLITKGQYAGYVLVAGGIDDSGTTLKSAELYNPNTGQFTPTGSMTQARSSMSGASLP